MKLHLPLGLRKALLAVLVSSLCWGSASAALDDGIIRAGETETVKGPISIGSAGIFSLDVYGNLNVTSEGSILLLGGHINIYNGGNVDIQGKLETLSAVPGSIQLNDGGALSIANIDLQNSGILDWRGGILTSTVNIAAGTNYSLGSGTRALNGTFTNNGTLYMSTGMLTVEDVTSIGSGSNQTGSIYLSSGTLVNNKDFTLGWLSSSPSTKPGNGIMNISGGALWNTKGNVVLNSGSVSVSGATWNATAAGANPLMQIKGASVTVADGGVWTTAGFLNLMENAGRINLQTGATWNQSGTASVTGGVVSVSGAGTVWNTTGSFIVAPSDAAHTAAVNVSSGTWAVSSTGDVTISGGSVTVSGGVWDIKGRLQFDKDKAAAGCVVLNGGTMNVATFTLKDGNYLNWQSGTLNTAATIDSGATYALSGAGNRIFDGSMTVKGIFSMGGTGSFEARGPITVGKSGGAGALNVSNGSLTTKGSVALGNASGSQGNANVTGGVWNVSAGNVDVANGKVAVAGGNWSVNGGSVTQSKATGAIEVSSGNWNVSSGSASLSDGTVAVSGGQWNISGSGAVSLSDKVAMTLSSGSWNISGGTTNINAATMALSGGAWNVSGGTVNLNGGTLALSGGAWNVSGGTVNLAGSKVEISGGILDITTGNFNTAGAAAGAVVLKSGGTYKANSYSLKNASVLDWQAGTLRTAASIAAGQAYDMTGEGDRSLDGTLTTNGNLTLNFSADAATGLDFGSLTVSGNISVGNGSIFLQAGTLTTNGTINLGQSGATGKMVVSGGTWIMNGGIDASASARSIVLKDLGTLQTSGIALQNGMALDWQGGTLKTTGASVAASKTYTMTGAGERTLDGTLTVVNGGALVLAESSGVDFGTLAVKGRLNLNSAGAVTVSSGVLDMTNGTLGSSTPAGAIILNGKGTYKTASYNLISDTVLNWQGGTLETNASITTGSYTLTGAGARTLKGDLNISNGGDLVLNTAGSSLTVTGTLNLSGAGSTVSISNGTLVLGSLEAVGMPAGSIILSDQGTLKIDNFNLKYANALTWIGGTLEATSVLGSGDSYTLESGRKLKGSLSISGDLTVQDKADLLNLTKITLNDGGKLELSSYALSNDGVLDWKGGTLKTDASIANGKAYTLKGAGDRVMEGNLNLNTTGTLALSKDVDDVAFGTLKMKGTLTLNSAGAITISSGTLDMTAGTLAGALPAGSIVLKDQGTFKTTSFALADGGMLNWLGGTLETDATIASNQQYTMVSGRNLKGTLTMGDNALLILDGAVGLDGITSLSGTGGLKKTGSGTTTLSGANSYQGGTEIAAGTLSVGSAQGLGSGIVKLTGGTLALTGNVTLSNNLDVSTSGSVSLGGNVLSFQTARALTGAGPLTITNGTAETVGTFTLASLSDYSGNITLSGGKVKLNLTAADAIGSAGSLTANGTDNVLNLNSASQSKALSIASGASVTMQGTNGEWKGQIDNLGQMIIEAGTNPVYLGASSLNGGTVSELGDIEIKAGKLVLGASGNAGAVTVNAKNIGSTVAGTQLQLQQAVVTVTEDVSVKNASLASSSLTANNITVETLGNTTTTSTLEALNTLTVAGGSHSALALKAKDIVFTTGALNLSGTSSITAATSTSIGGTLTLNGVTGNQLGNLTINNGVLNLSNGAKATGGSFTFTGNSELHLDGGASKQETTLTLNSVEDLNRITWLGLKDNAITLKNNSHLIFLSGTLNLSPDSVKKLTVDATSEIISTTGDIVFDAIKDNLASLAPVRGIANAGMNKLILQNGAQIYAAGAKANEVLLNGSDVVLQMDLKGQGIDSVNVAGKTDVSGGARLNLRNTRAGAGTPASLGSVTASNATIDLSGFAQSELLQVSGLSLSSHSVATVQNWTLKARNAGDTILLSSNSTLTLIKGSLLDYSKMTVSSATLTSTDGKITLKSGGLTLKDASTITLTTSTVTGGITTISDSKTDTVNLVGTTVDDVTINSGDILNMSSASITGTGTFNNAVVNILAGTDNYIGTMVNNNSQINITQGANYKVGSMGINTGSDVQIDGKITGNITLTGGTASLLSGGEVAGNIALQGGKFTYNGGKLGGNLAFNAGPAGKSTVELNDDLTLDAGKKLIMNGAGTIDLKDNALAVNGLDGFSTLVLNGAGGTLAVNGEGTHTGDIELNGTTGLELGAASALGTSGTIKVQGNNKVTFADDADQTKNIQIASGKTLELSVTDKDSQAVLTGNVATATNNGLVTKTGAGSLTLKGDHAIYGLNVDAGTLNLEAVSKAISVRDSIKIKADAGLTIAGGTSLSASSIDSRGKLVLGDGQTGAHLSVTEGAAIGETTINAKSSLTAGGTISVSTGKTTVDGTLDGLDIALNSGAEVSGTEGAIHSDRNLNVNAGSSLTMKEGSTVDVGANINVKGDVEIDGALAVTDKTEITGDGSLTLNVDDSTSDLGNVTLSGNGELHVDGEDGKTVGGNYITMNGSSKADISDTTLALNGGKITLNGQSSLDLSNTTVNGSIETTNTSSSNSTSLGLTDVHISGNLSVAGGDLILSGENTVGGGLTISDSVNVSFKEGTTGTIVVTQGTLIEPDGSLVVDADNSFTSNVTMTGGEFTIVGNGKAGADSNFKGTITFDPKGNPLKDAPKLNIEGTFYQSDNITVNANADIAIAAGGELILSGGLSSGTRGDDTLTINGGGENGKMVINSSNEDFADDIKLGGGTLAIGANEAIGSTGTLIVSGDSTLQNVSKDATVSKDITVQDDTELTVQTDKDMKLAGEIDAEDGTLVKTGEGKLELSVEGTDSVIGTLTHKAGDLLVSGTDYTIENLELTAGEQTFTSEGGNVIHHLTAGEGSTVALADDTLGNAKAADGKVVLDGSNLTADGTLLGLANLQVGTSDTNTGSRALLDGVSGKITTTTVEDGSELTIADSELALGSLGTSGKLTLTEGTALTVKDTLTVKEGGTLTIEKDSTIDGALALAGGSMNLLSDFDADNSIAVSGNNSMSVALDATMSVNGLLTGQGSLEKTGEGVLVLNREQQEFAGTLALKDGSLVVNESNAYGSSSTLRISDSDVSVTYGQKGGSPIEIDSALSVDTGRNFAVNTAADTIWNGKLSGAKGLMTKTGDGTLTINDTNSGGFAVGIKVDKGTLALNGKVGSDITLGKNTTLSGNGSTSGHLSVSADDTIIEIGEAGKMWTPGGSADTLTLGSLRLESSVVDELGVHKTGTKTIVDLDLAHNASDKIVVTGTADLNNSQLEIRKGAYTSAQESSIADGTRYHVVEAGDVAGTFNRVVSHDFDLHNVHTEVTANGIDLVLSLNYKGIDKNENENSIFGTIEDIRKGGNATGDLQEIVDDLQLTRSGEEAKTALDSVGGLRLTSMMSSLLAGNTNHLRNLRDSMNKGIHRGTIAMENTSSTDVWVTPTAGYNKVDGDNNAPEFTRQSWGGMVGVDRAMGDVIAPENGSLVAGIAFGYDHASTDVLDARDDTNNYTVDLYASYRNQAWQHRASVGVGFHDFSVDRSVAVGDQYHKTGTGSTNGLSLNVGYELAYAIEIDKTSAFMPLFTVESSYATIDAYSESGDLGNAGLNVDSQDAWSTVLGIGGRYAKEFGLIANVPQARFELTALVTADVGDQGSPVKASFQGAPEWKYQMNPVSSSRVGMLFGAGVNVPVSSQISIFGGGTFEVRSETSDVSGNVGVRYSF